MLDTRPASPNLMIAISNTTAPIDRPNTCQLSVSGSRNFRRAYLISSSSTSNTSVSNGPIELPAPRSP